MGELEIVLVMSKPVPEVRTNFGVFVGPVRMEARTKTSAATTSATALGTAAFVRLNFVTFTDSSVLQHVGEETDHLYDRVAGPRDQIPRDPVLRPS